MSKKIVLGDKVKDITTGFEGIVTGICHYLNGCTQMAIQPRLDKNGKYRESIWMDIEILKLLKGGINLNVKSSGGPQSNQPPTSYSG